MAVHVNLHENDLYECQKLLHKSSWKTKLVHTSESKKYSIFLLTILLINTVIILVVAKHKVSSNNNHSLSVENSIDVSDYTPIDYQQEIPIESSSNIENESTEEYNQMNSDQKQYISLINEDDY